jgi:hypothetical protein
MPDQSDYLWRPVRAGLCFWWELKTDRYSLRDIADMNDALDVEEENRRRAQAAQEKK